MDWTTRGYYDRTKGAWVHVVLDSQMKTVGWIDEVLGEAWYVSAPGKMYADNTRYQSLDAALLGLKKLLEGTDQ